MSNAKEIASSEFPLQPGDGVVTSQPISVGPCETVWLEAYRVRDEAAVCLLHFFKGSDCPDLDPFAQAVTACLPDKEICLCRSCPKICLSDFGPGEYVLMRRSDGTPDMTYSGDVLVRVIRTDPC